MNVLTTAERELASRPVRSRQENAFHAEAYRNMGWAVFPLAPETKLPTKGSHGLLDATLDHEELKPMFAQPEINVGIRTGEISRLVVVDIDLHSKEANGHESMAELKRQGLELPFGSPKRGCGIVLTPTGGMHLYYMAPEGVQLKNSSGLLAPGIDTRAEGGYVVAPPSRTPKGAYVWQQIPRKGGILPAPEWLVESLKVEVYQPSAPRRPLKPMTEMPPKIREMLSDRLGRVAFAAPGQRNETLNREAFYLAQFAGMGFDLNQLGGWLLDAARQSGMPEWEARRTIDSAFRSQTSRVPAYDGNSAQPAPANQNAQQVQSGGLGLGLSKR